METGTYQVFGEPEPQDLQHTTDVIIGCADTSQGL